MMKKMFSALVIIVAVLSAWSVISNGMKARKRHSMMPSAEKSVVNKLDDISDQYSQTQNGLKQNKIAKHEKQYIQSIKGKHISGWYGKLGQVGTGLFSNDVQVYIKLNNKITLYDKDIKSHSRLATYLTNYKVGTPVEVKGTLHAFNYRLTQEGRAENPQLGFTLTHIESVR